MLSFRVWGVRRRDYVDNDGDCYRIVWHFVARTELPECRKILGVRRLMPVLH